MEEKTYPNNILSEYRELGVTAKKYVKYMAGAMVGLVFLLGGEIYLCNRWDKKLDRIEETLVRGCDGIRIAFNQFEEKYIRDLERRMERTFNQTDTYLNESDKEKDNHIDETLSNIGETLSTMYRRCDNIEETLSTMYRRCDRIERKLDQIHRLCEGIERKLD